MHIFIYVYNVLSCFFLLWFEFMQNPKEREIERGVYVCLSINQSKNMHIYICSYFSTWSYRRFRAYLTTTNTTTTTTITTVYITYLQNLHQLNKREREREQNRTEQREICVFSFPSCPYYNPKKDIVTKT